MPRSSNAAFGLSGPDAPRIAAVARAQGRPVAVALTVDAETRNQLAVSWTVIGVVAIDTYSLGPGGTAPADDDVDRPCGGGGERGSDRGVAAESCGATFDGSRASVLFGRAVVPASHARFDRVGGHDRIS